jgi:hypothetical protein
MIFFAVHIEFHCAYDRETWRDVTRCLVQQCHVGAPRHPKRKSRPVKTEIATLGVPDDMPRDAVVRAFEESATFWRTYPKLRRQNYLHDAQAGIASGV